MTAGFRLAQIAAAVWIAWLALLGLLGGMLAGRVWHAHYLPVASVLAVMVWAWLALFAGTVWRLVCGPDRGRALTYLLLGSAPACFLGGHVLYGLRAGNTRQVEYSLALKMLIPLGESLMDLEARFRYPERTTGEKVVMLAPEVASAREQVAAMDRHVRALESRLGRAIEGRVHWARGPLFGMQNKAIFGLCMGSRLGEVPPDDEGLAGVDRHEVAHCVFANFCPVSSEPPALLMEGWAEANAGRDPAELDLLAWDQRLKGRESTFRELTGPRWYHRHEWPVYVQGASLVNFILKQYGPERFIRLYTTCRLATFAEDCKRVLGADPDRIDAARWAAIERETGHEKPLARRLALLKVRPAIDRKDWEAFLADYLARATRLLAPYENVRLAVEHSYEETDAAGKRTVWNEHIDIVRSDAYRFMRRRMPHREEAILAHPRHSFDVKRKGSGEPWKVLHNPNLAPDRNYQVVLASIDLGDPFCKLAAYLLAFSEQLGNLVDTSGVELTTLERFTEDGKRYVRVGLTDRRASQHSPWRSVTVVVSADNFYAARSIEDESPDGRIDLRTLAYDSHDGIPVLRSMESTITCPGGGLAVNRVTAVDRHFGPIPQSEFDPKRLLDGSPFIQSSDRTGAPPTFADCYHLLLGFGVVCMAVGKASHAWILCRRPERRRE
jgi:hypothetical protein